MIRIALIAFATLATVAAASPAMAQAGAPVRTLNPSVTVEGSTVLIAERKEACADRNCAAKPAKRYVGAPSLGW